MFVGPKVRAEACWFILNATSCGTDDQIDFMIQHGSISALGGMLGESSMVIMALEGLERVLQVGHKRDKKMLDSPDASEPKDATGGSHFDVNECGQCPGCQRVAGEYCETIPLYDNPDLPTPSSSFSLATEQAMARRNISMSSSSSLTTSATGNMMVAKQAAKIWREHFVTCAICNNAYSRISVQVDYCKECKCHVCHKCNCTVFHLSYQEELWDNAEIDLEKPSKSKKKKQKAKMKKESRERAMAERGAEPVDGPGSGAEMRVKKIVTGEIAGDSDVNSGNRVGEVDLKEDWEQRELEEERQKHEEKEKDFHELFPEDGFEDDGDDLVDFFQKSGSILALAGKLGILDTSVPAEGKY